MAPPARARDTCPKNAPIEVVRGAVVDLSGVVACAKDFLEGVLPNGDRVSGTKGFTAIVVAHHENVERGGLGRTSELLRDARRVTRGGERKDINTSGVYETEVFVRQFNFGGVLGRLS